MAMTHKEYGFMVVISLLSFFSWLIILDFAFEMLISGESMAVLNWFNMGNVVYILIISILSFGFSLYVLIYLWKWAGIEKELKELKKEKAHGIL